MIVIDDAAWTGMLRHAETAYPQECCGILLGFQEAGCHRAASAIPCANQSGPSSRTRFLIDPEHLLEVRQQGQVSGLEIAGFYHSHPDKGAYFSDRDIQNCWPGYANVVLAVFGGRFRDAQAYLVDPGRRRAREVELLTCLSPSAAGSRPCQ